MSAENVGNWLGVQWGKSGWLPKIIFFSIVAALLAFCVSPNKPAPLTPVNPVAIAAPDPAIAAEKAKSDAAFVLTATFATMIKDSLRDPDSLVWESIRASDDAKTICIAYRAKNGFGGMNREFAVYANSKASQKPDAWNKHCTQPLNDMKAVRFAVK